MGVTECPFFPGKICYGTCPNNKHNIDNIGSEASEAGTSTENISVGRSLNPLRFFVSHASKIYNYEYYTVCERYPLN